MREFAREDERKLCIVFDNPEAGLISEESYEKAVDLAAALAWHFSTQEAEVSYLVPGRPRTRDLHEFLGWLAVIEPGKNAAAVSPHDPWREMNSSASDEYHIAVTGRARGTVPTAFWDSSYFVFVGEREPSGNSGN